MSTEAMGAIAPEASPPNILAAHDHDHDGGGGDGRTAQGSKPTGLHSPPESNNAKVFDGSDSELSDIEDAVADQLREEALSHAAPAPEDEDIGEIVPDHYSGSVPVFKPTMKQFKDFKVFVRRLPPRPYSVLRVLIQS